MILLFCQHISQLSLLQTKRYTVSTNCLYYELLGFLQEDTGQYESRRREFEAWLSNESKLLSGILSTKATTLSAKELKVRQDKLKVSLCQWNIQDLRAQSGMTSIAGWGVNIVLLLVYLNSQVGYQVIVANGFG